MATTTKKDLIDRVAAQTELHRSIVKSVIQGFLDNLIKELGRGNRIEFREFGVFEIKHRGARMAQNPKTLVRVPVPARRTVKFKPGLEMRAALDAKPAKDGAGRETISATIETFGKGGGRPAAGRRSQSGTGKR